MNLFQPLPGIERVRRSRPAALPSIGYRGFAVAPITLRALSRSLIYSPGDERARNARPYGVRTPSTAAGGPPPSKREVLGFRRSKPAALPSIAYRGFAVAPMTLRAPSRSHLYNPGCRVATLLVLMGVMGFLGDLRGRNRNLPLIP